MALYRNISADFGSEDQKNKTGPVAEERLDSGLDSLREESLDEDCGARDQLSAQFATLNVEYEEPWRTEITEDGDTYLHLAVIHEALDMAVKMIQMSTNHPFLNKQNYQRQTPLHLAVITQQHQVVDRLLKAGCDPTLVDNNGNTALHIACRTGSLASFGLLTQNCKKHLPSILQAANYSGQKCLHIAAVHGFLSMVENLVSLGADINEQEQCNGRTALHLAVDLQNLDLVRLLISCGADVNSLTYGGHSAYHLTHGRLNAGIQEVLYNITHNDLRELPESESEDEFDDELLSDDDEPYDDIKIMA